MDARPEYRPFPQERGRNLRQAYIEIPLFIRCLGLRGRSRILEVGCGTGVALPTLHRTCASRLLAGLDLDAAALDAARERVVALGPTVALLRADVRAIPVRDGYFDAVVDFGTCYHIARAEDALREIVRVLRGGGIFATETRLSQLLSHPVRARGRTLPLSAVPGLRPRRHAGLWQTFTKVA